MIPRRTHDHRGRHGRPNAAAACSISNVTNSTVAQLAPAIQRHDQRQQGGRFASAAATATLMQLHCLSGNASGGLGAGVYSLGGTLTVNNSTISGSTTAIQVVKGAIATLTGSTISTNSGTGVLVGSGSKDACVVTVHNADLSGNATGIQAQRKCPCGEWQHSTGGAMAEARQTLLPRSGQVNYSPWLGNAESRNWPFDSLVFASKTGESYLVNRLQPGLYGPQLSITLGGSSNPAWFVTPTGSVEFCGGRT